MGVLVGAGGIENTTDWNCKDLEGSIGNAKAFKRNNGECKGILIGPPMAPRFFESVKFIRRVFSHTVQGSRLRAEILRHGWQVDEWLRGTEVIEIIE